MGAAVAAAVAVPWVVAFALAGPGLLGRDLFDRLNVASVDLDAWGLRF